MHRADDSAAAVKRLLHRQAVFPAPKLVYRQNLRGHASQKQAHTLRFRAIVEHICAIPQIILRYAKETGSNLAPLVHHAHLSARQRAISL